MNKEIEELFKWLKDTKKHANRNLISEKHGEEMVECYVNNISDIKEKVELLNSMRYEDSTSYQRSYWVDKLITNEQEIISALEIMMQKKVDTVILKLIVEKLLTLPDEVKKDFYMKDFSISRDGNLLICGHTSALWPTHLHHNIYSLMAYHDKEVNLADNYKETVEKLLVDIYKLLNKAFIKEKLIPSQLVLTSINYCIDNWENWEIGKNKKYEHLFSMKLFKRNVNNLNAQSFISRVEDNIIPYNLQLEDGSYLMRFYITSIIREVNIEITSRSNEEIGKKLKVIESSINKINALSKYDLSFIDNEALIKLLRTNELKSNERDTALLQGVLSFSLALGLINKGNNKEVKKIKI